MSLMQQIKQNFQNNESFNQIPQSHPLRRNNSYMLFNQNQNQYNSPMPITQRKVSEIPKKPEQKKIKTLTQSQSALNIRGFNPMNHIPPKYDLYGFLKPLEKRKEDMSILQNKDSIKIPWCTQNSNKSGAMTRTELIELRRKEKLPDISYDLDKDGYVGGRDLVFSHLYLYQIFLK